MGKTDYRNIGILVAIVLVIYYPLFYTHYFYTDEIVQLWHYRKGSDFAMFLPQGRYLTDCLFRSLYSAIDTIPQLTWLRIFSLAGWVLCLPVWYTIIAKVSSKEGLPSMVPFFSVLYLACSHPFSVSVQWASCIELFIANTSGLIAGYIAYTQIKYVDRRLNISIRGIILPLLFGLISLFTYQNGFGCFLLPFLLECIARRRISRTILAAIAIYFLVYGVYFLLFRWQLNIIHAGASDRTGLMTNPLSKLYFFFAEALPGAFNFTFIVSENNMFAKIIYALIFGACLLINFSVISSPRHSPASPAQPGFTASPAQTRSSTSPAPQSPFLRFLDPRLLYTIWIIGAFLLIYLPSLIVRENYASNRTLLALDMAVFFWVYTTILELIKKREQRLIASTAIGVLFAACCWYNFHQVFIRPAANEYRQLKEYIGSRYTPAISTVEFIRSPEDLVRRKYGVSSSWDEFGLSSSYFAWVPDPLIRQLVFENTGSRLLASGLKIVVWPNRAAYVQARAQAPARNNVLVIDVEDLLLNKNIL